MLHKELTCSLPRENIFPITAPGVVSGSAQTQLPLWRAKASLLGTNFRFRLLGPVLCSTLADFRQRMRGEVDWSEISFINFRVHTKKSTLVHEGALLRILQEEVAKFPKKSEIPFQGDLLHVEIVNENLEISLETWSDDRKFLPLHAALLKAGVVEISDQPVSELPKFPIFEQLSEKKFPIWNFPLGKNPEFFFRVKQIPLALGFADDRKSEKNLIEKIKASDKDVLIVTKTNSNFTARSGLVWRPEVRWTDERGVWWELLKYVRM